MKSSETLADLFSRADAQQTAVIRPEDSSATTYHTLANQIDSLANSLQHSGLTPGEVVSVVLPNGLDYLICFLAVTRARLVAAPLNSAYREEEFRFYLEDLGAKIVIAPPGDHPARKAAATLGLKVWTATLDAKNQVKLEGEGWSERTTGTPDMPKPDDVALFLHTSGTTSRPKGVPLTHANLMRSVSNISAHYKLTPADIGLVVMPLFHVHGLIGSTLSTFRAGGTVVVPPRFSAQAFWPTVRANRVNWYSAVPTIHQILVTRADTDDAPRQSGFRFIRSCSAALLPATLADLESRFGAPVLEAYAMTEASHQMTSNPLPPAVHKPGTVGQGTNVDVAIMDEAGNLLSVGAQGEVVVRGDNVTKGYHNNPEANKSSFTNGWFRTGDRGVMDSEGYVTLIGRIKELINRGGEKISPLEVDAALLSYPAIAEVATFGVPDAKYGEEVQAAVVLKADATKDQILAHCRDRLSEFKVPKVLYILKELPRTATGKVQRRHVATFCLEQGK